MRISKLQLLSFVSIGPKAGYNLNAMFVTHFTVCNVGPQPQMRREAGQEAGHDIPHLMAVRE